MSAPPAARIGTLVSWLTGTISSLTPRRLAYSSASTQAGPENCAPLPVVFSGSQGNSPIAAAPRVLPRAQSLAAQVADAIVDAIGAGTVAPGQRLVETDLARRLAVSRVPVREALKMLEAQGILVAAPHRGARVVEFDELKIDRICQVRVALERLALPDAIATFARQPQRLAVLEELI